MVRNVTVLAVAAAVVALPFLLRQPAETDDWRPGDPVLTIVTPHNEAIRYEFARAFSEWHRQHHGRPVKVDWLNIGGATEISRYLVSEYVAAMRAWWTAQGKPWPAGAADDMLAIQPSQFPEIHAAFRAVDDPGKVTARIDLFFGGGEYDHTRLFQQGLTVPVTGLPDFGYPAQISGETWRTATLFGNTVSTFGICYNRDRLRDLGVVTPPRRWVDLTDPVYFGQVGVADPTKSGSIAKAFEMIIQQQCHEAVRAAGFTDAQVDELERAGKDFPPAYNAAVGQGWLNGVRLVQLIGANARYFTDSASKVPIDVSTGDAAVGLAIDFYARFQAQTSRDARGAERMVYVTPAGGSSVSCDPVGLLRGAPNRTVAVRFIEFTLSEAGQKLWCYRPGTPGGPKKYALRRLPIREEFYRQADRHLPFVSDPLNDPLINPYRLAEQFVYRSRWTARLFNVQRDLIRAMCLDSADELRAAWRAIVRAGGPARCPAAMAALQRLPVTWANAREVTSRQDRLTYLGEWTEFFRRNYREARNQVGQAASLSAAGNRGGDKQDACLILP